MFQDQNSASFGVLRVQSHMGITWRSISRMNSTPCGCRLLRVQLRDRLFRYRARLEAHTMRNPVSRYAEP
jgi:hypothetical protein